MAGFKVEIAGYEDTLATLASDYISQLVGAFT